MRHVVHPFQNKRGESGYDKAEEKATAMLTPRREDAKEDLKIGWRRVSGCVGFCLIVSAWCRVLSGDPAVSSGIARVSSQPRTDWHELSVRSGPRSDEEIPQDST